MGDQEYLEDEGFVDEGMQPSPDVLAGYALQDNDFETIRELVTSGQISLKPDEYGNSFLHYAAASASPEMIKMLVAMGGDMHAVNEQGLTPYEIAMTSWNSEGLMGFIDAGLSLDTHGSKKMPLPLEVAALADWQTMETFLEKTGVDVNYKDESGYTMLHVACEYGNLGTVTTLMQKGADPNQKDAVGSTPLHRLVAYSHLAPERELCIDRLIYLGADLNARDNKGKTPLHLAVQFSEPRIVEKLIKEGADLNIKDHEGKTPLDRLNEKLNLMDKDSEQYAKLKAIKHLLMENGARSGNQQGFADRLRGAAMSELTNEPREQQDNLIENSGNSRLS